MRQIHNNTNSCTNLIIRFYESLLQPKNHTLSIKVAFIYRAHWTVGMYPARYNKAVHRARFGLQRLMNSPISISAFSHDDWELLKTFCDFDVDISEEVMKTRRICDEFVQSVLLSDCIADNGGAESRSLEMPEVSEKTTSQGSSTHIGTLQ